MTKKSPGNPYRASPFISAFLCLLAGCSQQHGSHAWQPTSELSASQSVSAEDFRAAKSLSLASAGPSDVGNGYASAAKCTASIEFVTQVMNHTSLGNERERQALNRAAALYRARTFELAGKGQKTDAQVAAEINRIRADAADDSASAARDAMSCIRQLAGEAGRQG